MNNATSTLIAAKAAINSNVTWTQIHAAEDINGMPVKSTDSTAVSFSPYGAISSVIPNDDYFEKVKQFNDAARFLIAAIKELSVDWISEEEIITDWNDRPNRTHDEVMDVFNKAIELAGKSK